MIESHRVRQAALIAALLAVPGLHAAEVAGVKVDESVRVGGNELVLNGAGLRSKLFIKLYVGALYVGQKNTAAGPLIDGNGPRRLTLRLLRDISADSLHSALDEGLANNNSPAELDAVRLQAESFGGLMKGFGKLREGDLVSLDFTNEGLTVGLNGEVRGKVAGAAFNRALLRVWLGEKPADASLKKALLGN